MSDRELMQQALEALTVYDGTNGESKRKRVLAALRAALAEPQQEPYCYHDGRNIVGKEFADHSDVFPLYVAPRQWQGLTDEELDAMRQSSNLNFVTLREFRIVVRAVEAKLKERNG